MVGGGPLILSSLGVKHEEAKMKEARERRSYRDLQIRGPMGLGPSLVSRCGSHKRGLVNTC